MNQMRYEDALTKVYNEVLAYQEVFGEIDKDTQFTPNQLYNASAKKMMLAVDQSNHRTEILNEILRKEHLLFRLIEEDKSEVLSIVLRTLTEAERETYVNLV